jgi:acetyl-CoA C-acetyltransferase
VLPVEVSVPDEDGTRIVQRDEGMRETHLEKLAQLKPNLPDRARQFHTAGTSSQISDGAGAVLLMTPEAAERLNLEPMARVVGSCLVGSDPALMLTGPMPATRKLLADAKLEIDDIDVFEVNEAFAAVVVAWRKEVGADMDRVNPNGGAIALGHPLGGTGAILLTKAVHELRRTGGRYGLVSMCCGGGLGTGTLIEAV